MTDQNPTGHAAPGPQEPTLGRVVRDHTGLRLEYERVLQAPREQVWRMFVDSTRLGEWYGTYSGDPATGSVDLTLLDAPEGYVSPVRILECTAPERLVTETPMGPGKWHMDLRLEPAGGDVAGAEAGAEAAGEECTRLTFVHPLDSTEQLAEIGAGWQWYLDTLTAVVHGTPRPPEWDEYWKPVAAHFEREAEG